MSFTDTIATLPYAPTSDHGTGLLAPLLRSLTHLTTALVLVHRDPEGLDTAYVQRELDDALEHVSAARTSALSAGACTLLVNLATAIGDASNELETWDATAAKRNLQALAHRGLGIAARFDRELCGYTDSDPGRLL